MRLHIPFLLLAAFAFGQTPEQWGAPPVQVTHANGAWTIAGRKQTVTLDEKTDLEKVRRMASLHRRIGALEMVTHEFLDPERRRERTTYADGTTVTVDWQSETLEIKPELQ